MGLKNLSLLIFCLIKNFSFPSQASMHKSGIEIVSVLTYLKIYNLESFIYNSYQEDRAKSSKRQQQTHFLQLIRASAINISNNLLSNCAVIKYPELRS